jgi:hypothetical protein
MKASSSRRLVAEFVALRFWLLPLLVPGSWPITSNLYGSSEAAAVPEAAL